MGSDRKKGRWAVFLAVFCFSVFLFSMRFTQLSHHWLQAIGHYRHTSNRREHFFLSVLWMDSSVFFQGSCLPLTHLSPGLSPKAVTVISLVWFVFWDRVLLYSSGWPSPHCIDQASLELTAVLLPPCLVQKSPYISSMHMPCGEALYVLRSAGNSARWLALSSLELSEPMCSKTELCVWTLMGIVGQRAFSHRCWVFVCFGQGSLAHNGKCQIVRPASAMVVTLHLYRTTLA